MSKKKTDELDEMTVEQLEAKLAEKKKAEKEAQEKERKEYEDYTESLIRLVHKNAKDLHNTLVIFKSELQFKMDEQQERLNNYGKIRSNSKGGFMIISKDGNIRIRRIRSTEPIWNEKSTKAVELIGNFLRSTVKKHDKKLFEILMSFIEKNQAGDLEYDRVMQLVQHEDKYDDPNWKEGLRLIKESFSLNLRGYGYLIEERDQTGKWNRIEMNFASIKPVEIAPEKPELLE